MENQKISELKAGTGKINLEGVVWNLDDPKDTITKFGKKTKTQKLTLQDNSGQIELSLWGEDCGLFKKGDNVEITNGWVSEYKGNLQLSTGKFGKIERIQIESEPIAEKKMPEPLFVSADQIKINLPNENQVREWSMKRGGFSHDAAVIVAAMLRMGSITNERQYAIKAQIEITDTLVKAAEEREIKFRKGGV